MKKESLEFINKLIDEHQVKEDEVVVVYFNEDERVVGFRSLDLSFGRVANGIDIEELESYEHREIELIDLVMLLNN